MFRLSEAELQANLEERLPFSRTYLFVVEVTFQEPRVTLEEGSDRVAAGLDVAIDLPGITSPIEVRGSLDATSGIRYEPTAGELYLVEPEIRRLSVEGIPDAYTDRVNEAVARAIGEYYSTRPIYRLTGTDLRQAAARLLLSWSLLSVSRQARLQSEPTHGKERQRQAPRGRAAR